MKTKMLGITALLTGAVLAALVVVATMDYEDERAEARRYCADVALWHSQANLPKVRRDGHPDFRNIATEVCP